MGFKDSALTILFNSVKQVNGKNVGQYIEYFENGQTEFIEYFNHNSNTNKTERYYPTGELFEEIKHEVVCGFELYAHSRKYFTKEGLPIDSGFWIDHSLIDIGDTLALKYNIIGFTNWCGKVEVNLRYDFLNESHHYKMEDNKRNGELRIAKNLIEDEVCCGGILLGYKNKSTVKIHYFAKYFEIPNVIPCPDTFQEKVNDSIVTKQNYSYGLK